MALITRWNRNKVSDNFAETKKKNYSATFSIADWLSRLTKREKLPTSLNFNLFFLLLKFSRNFLFHFFHGGKKFIISQFSFQFSQLITILFTNCLISRYLSHVSNVLNYSHSRSSNSLLRTLIQLHNIRWKNSPSCKSSTLQSTNISLLFLYFNLFTQTSTLHFILTKINQQSHVQSTLSPLNKSFHRNDSAFRPKTLKFN